MVFLAHLSWVTTGVSFGLWFLPLLPCSFGRILAFAELRITSLFAVLLLISTPLGQDKYPMVSPLPLPLELWY